jgi:hypothetical protein
MSIAEINEADLAILAAQLVADIAALSEGVAKVAAGVAALEAKIADIEARRTEPHFSEELRDGKILTTAQAADIRGVSQQAITAQCAAAEEAGEWVGVRWANVWWVSLDKLLASIKDPHDRLIAKGRAEKIAPKVARSQSIRLKK